MRTAVLCLLLRICRRHPGADNCRGAGKAWPDRRPASLNWNASLGIAFYEFKSVRVFRLPFKGGKPTFDLSYTDRFNLSGLKQPVIEIVRHSS